MLYHIRCYEEKMMLKMIMIMVRMNVITIMVLINYINIDKLENSDDNKTAVQQHDWISCQPIQILQL